MSLEVMPFYKEIGRRIRDERKALGFTQYGLAKKIGMPRTAIVQIEAGRQRLLLHTLYDIAHTLGIPVKELLPKKVEGRA
jgi:transcriptional regulator with XRE-family HTH domain